MTDPVPGGPPDHSAPSEPRSRTKIAAVELARVLFSAGATIAAIIFGYYAIKWLMHR
jgi:hypothetical protein